LGHQTLLLQKEGLKATAVNNWESYKGLLRTKVKNLSKALNY